MERSLHDFPLKLFSCMLARRLTPFKATINTLLQGFADDALARGLNIKKGGADPPLKPLENYPEWVKALPEKEKTLYEFKRQVEGEGEEALGYDEAIRYVKLTNRASIQQRNNVKAKK